MPGVGVFGKIPSEGDFLRKGLPVDFIQIWDRWLQRGLAEMPLAFGARWDALYLTAPIWRFCLPAGLAGAETMLGILMPSVDRVGRRYPLTLAQAVGGGPAAPWFCANTALYAQLERAALDSLDAPGTQSALLAAISHVQAAPPTSGLLTQSGYRGTAPATEMLAAEALTARFGTAAIWSMALDEDHRILTTPGLPDGPALQALFDLSLPASGSGISPQVAV